MSLALSRHQLEREAKLLLKRLSSAGCYLDYHAVPDAEMWGLMTQRNRHAHAVLRCENRLVKDMQTSGWIESDQLGRRVLSACGQAWLAVRGIKDRQNARADGADCTQQAGRPRLWFSATRQRAH